MGILCCKCRKFVLCFDPGNLGGIALICLKCGKAIEASRMPVIYTRRAKPSKKTGKYGQTGMVDEKGIVEFICKHLTQQDTVYAAIEGLHASKFSKVTNWKLGGSFRTLIGICTMAGFDVRLLPPSQWQRITFGVARKKANKKRSIAKAKELHPNMATKIGSSDGVAEALLIGGALRKMIMREKSVV